MATAAVRRLFLRVRPVHLRPRFISVARPSRAPEVSSALPHTYELNPEEGIGDTLFEQVQARREGTPESWDALFPYILDAFKIQKRSPIPLFLQLDKRGLLKTYGRGSSLYYFLKENDSAMIDYCLKVMDSNEYSAKVFPEIIYYLEKAGRHDEADVIVKNSFHLITSAKTFHVDPPRLELIKRAVARSDPFFSFQSAEWLNANSPSYLCNQFHDQELEETGSESIESRYRAKNYMTRSEFRATFEKELWVESNPSVSCSFTKVDQLNITAREANANYVGKISKFIDQLVKQFEVGMLDYVTKKQMVLREVLFHPDVLDSGNYTAADYYVDLIFMLMEPERTAKMISYYFYRDLLIRSAKVSQETAHRLLSVITKMQMSYLDIFNKERAENLYKVYEQVHYDMPEEVSRLPIRYYINHLVSEGEGNLSCKSYIPSGYTMQALARIVMNTLHVGRFRRLNGEWARIFTFDLDKQTLHIDPALDPARAVFKDTDIVKIIDATKMPLEAPPLFKSELTTGGGKLVINMTNVMLCLTPMKFSAVVGDALDAVGQVAYKLDPRVIDTIMARLNELRLDRADYILCIPPALQTLSMVKQLGKDVTGVSDTLLAQQAAEEYKGMRQDIGNRMTICNYFRDERPYWGIPVLDFRGRHYNRSSFLANTSPDVIRGMIRFATGVPLGSTGWDWLRVHMANLHGGCKKKTRQQKVEFVNDRMDDIIRSVENPNEGHQFWKECDSPVQALITCFEVVDALRSGCPEDFVSHLPCHQDGSCNGMQHYSALGRDMEGARLVSLSAVPSSLDLYSSVAKRVQSKLVDQLDNKMLPDNIHTLARKSMPFAIRKIVKQTVMTTVYGVTKSGAEMQIERSIKRQYGQSVPDLNRIAPHLVKTIFEVLDEVFAVARKIQRWLLTCVARVSAQGYFMTWETPLGLVVEQPYAKVPLGNTVKSRLYEPKFVLDTGGEFDVRIRDVSASKHTIAFAPNFIHSLDATHMMMTAMQMRKEGFVYGAVHDSYWTHAAHVDDMNRIIREQFVALYQQPIIENLAAQLQEHFGDPNVNWKEDVFLNFPKPGHFDITEVLQSERFFS